VLVPVPVDPGRATPSRSIWWSVEGTPDVYVQDVHAHLPRSSLCLPSDGLLFQHEIAPVATKMDLAKIQESTVKPAVPSPEVSVKVPGAVVSPAGVGEASPRSLETEMFSIPMRKSSRTKTNSSVFLEEKYPGFAFANAPSPSGEPMLQTALHEVPDRVAMRGPDREEWARTKMLEVKTLVDQCVWHLVHPDDVPPNTRVLPGRWVLVVKYINGAFDKRKARWVVRGDLQKHGFSYTAVFAPVANMNSVHIFFSYVASQNMETLHVDFVAAFSNSDIDMDGIYVRQPTGQEVPGKEDWVCLLLKALYGLRQAPLLWHKDVVALLTDLGFSPISGDPCLFVKRDEGRIVTIILLHVDDLAIGYHKDYALHEKFLGAIKDKWPSKDLGPISCFLNMTVERDSNGGVILSQEPYLKDVLERFSEFVDNGHHAPANHHQDLFKYAGCEVLPEGVELADPGFPYLAISGSLRYLEVGTRIDIACILNICCQNQARPLMMHQVALCWLLGYLSKHPSETLHYKAGSPFFMHVYADASHLFDMKRSLSQIAYIVFLCGAPIAWKSTMPKPPYLSSTTAEIAAAREAVKTIVALRVCLIQLGMSTVPTVVFEDNKATIDVSQSVKHHTRLRHVIKDCNYLKYHVECGDVVFCAVGTKDQIADWLTKLHSKAVHERFCVYVMHTHPVGAVCPLCV
jgi:hypothetical protein